jgi:hypothetical protein
VSPSQLILAIPARSIRTAGNRRSASDLENVHNELRFHMGTRFLIDAVRNNTNHHWLLVDQQGLSDGAVSAIVVQLGEAALQRRDEKCADLRRCRRDSMALLIVPSLVGRLSFGEELTRRRRGDFVCLKKTPCILSASVQTC